MKREVGRAGRRWLDPLKAPYNDEVKPCLPQLLECARCDVRPEPVASRPITYGVVVLAGDEAHTAETIQ
jgi:hypothetical protein